MLLKCKQLEAEMAVESKRMVALMIWLSLLSFCGSVSCQNFSIHDFRDSESQEGINSFVEEEKMYYIGGANVHLVGLTLLAGADSKGAVCLDGSLPGYHFDPGFGSGGSRWLIQLEGGGWCNTIRNCVARKASPRGSSNHMEKELPFTGILSNKAAENPYFYNWNRVKLRYCDGASFAGEGQNEAAQLYFRGQRIWSFAMETLMAKGMRSATHALLSGCSAGGLATIIHCDEFGSLFSSSVVVKCLSDAGMFLDTIDVSGGHSLRNMYSGVVNLQDVRPSLPNTCTYRLDSTSCFFPQYLINSIRTPMFLLNTAYDVWQLQEAIAPPSADPHGYWSACKRNFMKCNFTQISRLQAFRNQMLNSFRIFEMNDRNGLFINSCFAHCQSERQDTWFAPDSPRFGNLRIAEAVAEWFYGRNQVKSIDCPYPCDRTCHNLVARSDSSLL